MVELHRLPLTGPNQERAAAFAQNIIDALQTVDDDGLEGVIEAAWRMARGQTRWIVAGRSRGELIAALAEFVLDGTCVASGQHRTGPRRATFVFSGMGPQWWGMGRAAAAALPGFGRRLGEIDAQLAEHYGGSVWSDLERHEGADQLPTGLAQPGNFLLQAALHDLLVDDGIIPEAIIGHSAGEVAAAYAAGVYDLAEAARVAVVRGRLQATLAGRGAMMAVGLGEDEAAVAIADLDGVSIAAINDHEAVTVAGDESQIGALEDRLREGQVFAKRLRVEVPYHSPVMDEIAAELDAGLRFLAPKPARVPLYSTVSGMRSTGEEWGAGYWPRNVRQPVRFAAAIEAAIAEGSRSFVEIAPHPVLAPSITALTPRDAGMTVTPLLSRRDDEYQVLLRAVGTLALEGIGRPTRRRPAVLPAPTRSPQRLWDQDRWYELDRTSERVAPQLSLLGRRVADHGDEFEVELSLTDQPWIAGHEVQGLGPVVPATMWAELMALAATGGEDRSVSLLDLTIVQGLPVVANPVKVRIELTDGTIRCSSRPVGDPSSWSLHAVASVGPAVPTSDRRPPASTLFAGPVLDADALYSLFRLKGLRYGGSFRNLRDVRLATDNWNGADDPPLMAVGAIDGVEPFVGGLRSPWVLDAGLQLLIAAAQDLGEAMYLPARIGRTVLHRSLADGRSILAVATVDTRTEHELVGTIRYHDPDGSLVAELCDVVCVRNQSDDAARAHAVGRTTYCLRDVSSAEVADRFTPDDEIADPAPEASPVAATMPGSDGRTGVPVDPGPAERWLEPGPRTTAGPGPRPVLDIAEVPRGDRLHLLWAVPSTDRTADAVATFELVNRVAALDDPTLTLTLIGDVDQRWLLGLRRSASNAFGFPVRAVLVGPSAPAGAVDAAVATVDEYEIMVDAATTYSRLEAVPAASLQTIDVGDRPPGATLAYDLSTPSTVDVTVEAVRTPGPGEVTIETWAVPLTWKDVGKAFGSIGTAVQGTFAGQHLGLGAVGRVVEVGAAVALAPGDVVGGPIRRPLRHRMTLDVADEYLRWLPEDVDPVTQLAMMMPWVTALAAVVDVGRVKPGDAVLVQSGAGALGTVLCRLALEQGAEVATTVGTEAKRDHIRRCFEHRVEAVVARAEDVPGALLGAGQGPFDCILATVNGPARSLLMSQLRTGGRYVDLGKPSGPGELQLAAGLHGNRSWCRIDTDQIAADDPAWFDDLVTRALARVADEDNHSPITRYPVAQLPAAIGDLARGDTVGSLVVDLTEAPTGAEARWRVPPIDPDGTYLITGGYGGVGLMCAQWLASRGARTIVVTGRSGQASERGQASIDLLNAAGADIWVLAADVADRGSTIELLAEINAEGPIRGIIHAAGVIADGPFEEIDPERVRRSFAAKLDGADNLIAALDELDGGWGDLDFLLFTSSMSGALGVSLQGTYAAANTGLDGIAERLRNQGVHACAMQLGPIEEGGMAADDERNARFFAANGLSMVAPRQLFGMLDLATTATAPVVMTADIDWQRVGRSEPGNARSSVIGHLVAQATSGADHGGLDELLALGPEERADVLSLTLVGLFAEALGIDDDSLEPETSFADMGIDSLAVVEIQVGIGEILQHEVPMARLFAPDGTIAQLAARMAEYLEEVVVDHD